MDPSLIRLALGLLGALASLCVALIGLTASTGHEPPQVLGYIAVGCANAIVGILVQPRGSTGATGPAGPTGQTGPPFGHT